MSTTEAISMAAMGVAFFGMWAVAFICKKNEHIASEEAETRRLQLELEHEREMARIGPDHEEQS